MCIRDRLWRHGWRDHQVYGSARAVSEVNRGEPSVRAGGFLFCVWRLKGFTVCLPPAHNYPVGANIIRPQHDRSLCKERPHIRLTITWEHNMLPYGMTCTDRIATVNHGRKTVQIRPEKTFSKKFEKRVDETGILLYTKQVVSDESSKTTTT